jgi:acyl-coenzyme A synthetase/AMP-(fatty) acid ligase
MRVGARPNRDRWWKSLRKARTSHRVWRAPEETAGSFRNGRLYTGDLATVDKDGFIYALDRAKEFLKCAGKRASFRNIEDRLLQHQSLIDAAVIGIPDDVTGEAVKAFVVPCDPAPTELEARTQKPR